VTGSPRMASIGDTLRGKWHLDGVIGSGGMGSVFAATHRNGMRGAVKILHAAHSTSDESRERFRREGYIANKIGHPSVVLVLDDDIAEDGSPFLVMELLEGASLAARAADSSGRLPPQQVMLAIDEVLDVLAVAHDAGVVHRDIKPENIFVTSEGLVKVLDFGIAHLAEAAAGDRGLTQTGIAMGTPAFMSPEQARGRWDLVGAPSDLFAVGATMFTLVSGEFVHPEGTTAEIAAATFTKQARSLADAMPDAPPALVRIVDRALRLAADERWSDARAMQLALREAYAEVVGEPLPPQPAPGRMTTRTPFAFHPVPLARAAGAVDAKSGAPHQQETAAPVASRPPAQLGIGRRRALVGATAVALLLLVVGVGVVELGPTTEAGAIPSAVPASENPPLASSLPSADPLAPVVASDASPVSPPSPPSPVSSQLVRPAAVPARLPKRPSRAPTAPTPTSAASAPSMYDRRF
jgi:hypothetical protein